MTDDYARHNARMAKVAAAREKMQARRTLERGLLIVHTGNGKGKSSSAFGMAIRSIGWGLKVAILQYVKGKWETGERNFFEAHPDLATFEVMGEGFTWDTQDRARDIAAARAAWELAKAMIGDPSYRMVLLDELNIAVKHGYLDLDTVLRDLQARPPMQHVIVTGRGAKPELIELADTVTEMGMIKHAFQAGIRAQKGIEL